MAFTMQACLCNFIWGADQHQQCLLSNAVSWECSLHHIVNVSLLALLQIYMVCFISTIAVQEFATQRVLPNLKAVQKLHTCIAKADSGPEAAWKDDKPTAIGGCEAL